MIISTRGRYALRVMTDLAEHSADGCIPMKDVAKRQNISLKYLEKILPVLTKNGIITGIQGKECGTAGCDRAGECKTLPVWTELDRIINEYLDSVTVADLLKDPSAV